MTLETAYQVAKTNGFPSRDFLLEMPKHLYPKEVAALLGISTSQLRKPFYGRLSGVRRTKGKQRRFRDTKAFRSEIEALILRRERRREESARKLTRRQSRSDAAWAWGDKILVWISHQHAARAGATLTHLIGEYSRMTGHHRDWVKDRYDTAQQFPPAQREPRLLWVHHRLLARVPRKTEWLKLARAKHWGPRKLRDEIIRAHDQPLVGMRG